MDRDGTGTLKAKLRPVALLETPLKLIEFIAVDQHADHTVSQQQNRQVGLRGRHGSEATVRAVRRLWKDKLKRILTQDTAYAYDSMDRFDVLQHVASLAPLCAAQFVKDGTRAVVAGEKQQRRKDKAPLHSLGYCVARKHGEQRDVQPDVSDQDCGPSP